MKDVNLAEKFPFCGVWWNRECYSNIKLGLRVEAGVTRSMDDAMCAACCEVEREGDDLVLATVYIFEENGTLYIDAVTDFKSHREVLQACPKCGGYVYTDSRTGPLHPLNGCSEVLVEEVMVG